MVGGSRAGVARSARTLYDKDIVSVGVANEQFDRLCRRKVDWWLENMQMPASK